jgi:hypothetical protein
MRCPVSGNKSYGSIRTCYDVSLLLGLLIRYKCDDCQYFLFSSPGDEVSKPYLEVKFDDDNILDNMRTL